jgi:Pyridoxamine 5'-phosphate oxidase
MISLEAIRNCLEGAVPSCMATSDLDGTPNVSYVSQVRYVDRQHVIVTFQFFNRSHKNIVENPQ